MGELNRCGILVNRSITSSPQEVQLERLMLRDGITTVDAHKKMNTQMLIEEKVKLAHHVIDNSHTLAETRSQTDSLLKELTPSNGSVVVIWILLLWPAIALYTALALYQVVDRLYHSFLFFSTNNVSRPSNLSNRAAPAG